MRSSAERAIPSSGADLSGSTEGHGLVGNISDGWLGWLILHVFSNLGASMLL